MFVGARIALCVSPGSVFHKKFFFIDAHHDSSKSRRSAMSFPSDSSAAMQLCYAAVLPQALSHPLKFPAQLEDLSASASKSLCRFSAKPLDSADKPAGRMRRTLSLSISGFSVVKRGEPLKIDVLQPIASTRLVLHPHEDLERSGQPVLAAGALLLMCWTMMGISCCQKLAVEGVLWNWVRTRR